jgi:hypothetical protein
LIAPFGLAPVPDAWLPQIDIDDGKGGAHHRCCPASMRRRQPEIVNGVLSISGEKKRIRKTGLSF